MSGGAGQLELGSNGQCLTASDLLYDAAVSQQCPPASVRVYVQP